MSTLSHEVDIVHEDDTILDNDTYQKDDTQGTDHIKASPGEPECHDDTGERREDRQHDDERHAERLELRRHGDIDEQDDECEEQSHVAEGLLLVLVVTTDMG